MNDLNTLSLEQLYAAFSTTGLIRRVLELGRDEDVGPGDITSEVCIAAGERGEGAIVARQSGVVAGLAVLPDLVRVFGSRIVVESHVSDGDRVEAGTRVARLSGDLRGLLTFERTALNIVGRLSGIATLTGAFVREARLSGARAQVYDTRKTSPGLRVLEKYAVRCGGGRCHRIGLHDAVLIKDNHIAGEPVSRLAGTVADASRRAREARPGLSFVEVEVDSLEQLAAVLTLPPRVVDIVLLDNLGVEDLRRAVAMRDEAGSSPELEASGGVRLETVGAIAGTGVDRISAGALTHSAPSIDVALDIAR